MWCRKRYSFAIDLRGGIDWQDPGNRRQAFYTDLRPGQYRFQVIASNNDGVWNTTGATLDFSILPAFYQTIWSRILLGIAAAGLMWMLYSLRVRQVTASIKARLGERLHERERIARELHDTLLQDFHAAILHLQAASAHLGKDDPTRKAFEQGLDYADEVLVQGRDRIYDLRSDTNSEDEWGIIGPIWKAARGATDRVVFDESDRCGR